MSEGQHVGILEGAFLCDTARDYGGRLSALGVFINLVRAPELPTVRELTLVIRVGWVTEGSSFELEDYPVDVTVRDPDGEPIQGATFRASAASQTNAHPELPAGANLVLPLVLELRRPGVHTVDISLEGHPMKSLPFKVIDPTAPE